jgi:putative radical SAM enzyme (TIGR03279 family)
VDSGSLAEELEIGVGDRVLAINGHRLRDLIDYHYHAADEELVMLVQKSDGDLWELEFDRTAGESIGIQFRPPLPAKCGNNCTFCFVHQLPKGLRKPLYVKDEDYRLSFLFGNYVTLANITPRELERIIRLRLSPLFVSVHTVDPGLRESMLGRTGLVPILATLEQLAAAGIRVHTQVVLCPGVNDGVYLEQTVTELARLHPAVASLAVVPVGLTRHRQRLPDLTAVTADYARDLLERWAPRQDALVRAVGEPFLAFADEFYLKAGIPFPPVESYGEFPQLENGVGMIPLFEEAVDEVMAGALPRKRGGEVTVVTGEAPFPAIVRAMERLSGKIGVAIRVVPVPNRLFGPQVTVTGLVCGGDILSALETSPPIGTLLVPDIMLKEGDGLFLDDLTLADLAATLHCPVISFPATPGGLVSVLDELFP